MIDRAASRQEQGLRECGRGSMGKLSARWRKAIRGPENEGQKVAAGSDRCEHLLDRMGRLKVAGTPLRLR